MSVRKPHTSEIRAAHPYRKKSWVPPPPGHWPLVKNVKKRLNFQSQRRLSVHVYDKFTLASTAHERPTLATLVSCKHNVVAKHGSSKLLTTNDLWLLEWRIKSTHIYWPPYPMHYGICAIFLDKPGRHQDNLCMLALFFTQAHYQQQMYNFTLSLDLMM